MATGRKRTAPDGSGDPKWTPPGQQSKAAPPAYQRNQARTSIPFKGAAAQGATPQRQPKGAQPLNYRPGQAAADLQPSSADAKRQAIMGTKKRR